MEKDLRTWILQQGQFMKQSNKRKLLLATSFVLLVCVFVNTAYAYTNGQYNFSAEPPSGWTVEEPSGAAVAFVGPTDQGFRVNINIQVESTDLSLAQYVSASKATLQTYQDFILLSEGARDRINNVDAYEVVLTFTYNGAQTLKDKQVYLINNGTAFAITYTALPATYGTYLSLFETSVETFKIGTAGPNLLWIIIPAVIVAVVIAVAALILLRRRRSPLKTASPPQIQIPPPPPS